MKLFSFFLILGISFTAFSQKALWDSLNIQYEIVQLESHPGYNLVKIKVPPYLSTGEVMEQVRKLLFWPNSPPPQKKTKVYIFKDTDPYGAKSNTGGVYFPGKGIKWDMRDWRPDSSLVQKPTAEEIKIYNAYLDSLFKQGMQFSELKLRHELARKMKLSAGKLDTIYYKVKFWQNLHRKKSHPY